MIHPYLMRRARVQASQELRKMGERLPVANGMVASLNDSDIEAKAATDPAYLEVVNTMGAIGDGTLLQALIAFFQSAQGQAIITALVELILGLLVVG